MWKPKVKRGRPIQELVKGSLDYTMMSIRKAFRDQFPLMDNAEYFAIAEIFDDHVIVSSDDLNVDEFYHVRYTAMKEPESGRIVGYRFDSRESWQVVELAYQTAATRQAAAARGDVAGDDDDTAGEGEGGADVGEAKGKGGRKRLDDHNAGKVTGTRRIKSWSEVLPDDAPQLRPSDRNRVTFTEAQAAVNEASDEDVISEVWHNHVRYRLIETEDAGRQWFASWERMTATSYHAGMGAESKVQKRTVCLGPEFRPLSEDEKRLL